MDEFNPGNEEEVVVELREELSEPPMYKVLLHNDDYTTMEFVVMILMSVFHHPEARAVEIMLHVHHHGQEAAEAPGNIGIVCIGSHASGD